MQVYKSRINHKLFLRKISIVKLTEPEDSGFSQP